MPTLQRFLRQRERINARTWKPLQPNLITYIIFSAVYTRTYSLVDVNINEFIKFYDPIPFGFRFNPTPDPPLVPLQQDSGINAIIPIGEVGNGLITIPNVPQILPSPPIQPPSPSPLSTPEQQNSNIIPSFFTIVCGTTNKKLNPVPLIVRTVTILADPNNIGVIWVNSVNSSGVNATFPIASGNGIILGDINSNKGIDISSIFVIGTDSGDQVRVITQQ